jgi:hypothetical protein
MRLLDLLPVTGLVAGLALLYPAAPPAEAAGSDGLRISGPVTHGKLALYFVHGTSASGPVPLTLQEAMSTGAAIVHETSDVNELAVENVGAEPVFVQAGDIVKGGQQDRVVSVSLLIPPKSGRIPIGAYCVEHGRWSQRGGEDVTKFASAAAAIPSKQAKLAMKAATLDSATSTATATTGEVAALAAPADTSSRQSEVWRLVSEMQAGLTASLDTEVAAATSASSLQLALENEKLAATRKAYVDALRAAGEADGDIIGYAFAIDGRINSADVYPSNGLFRKMWPKLLEASATEAIGAAAGSGSAPPPRPADIEAFLEAAQSAAPGKAQPLEGQALMETRESPQALYVATSLADGTPLHRNYLAK